MYKNRANLFLNISKQKTAAHQKLSNIESKKKPRSVKFNVARFWKIFFDDQKFLFRNKVTTFYLNINK